MNITSFKRALVIAPHTDDGEFGCGGTISKLISSGVEVNYLVFSSCEKSVPKKYPSDILKKELINAAKKLGIYEKNIHLLNYDVRTFNFHRQDILDDLIKYRNKLNPDIVFIPSINDIHQDHSTIAIESIRAFKFNTILSYELPWNNFTFSNTCFVLLDENHVNNKIEALSEYKSQSHRNYSSKKFVKSLAMTRGIQVNSKFAEIFEVVRIIM
jgi:LmbE family N-acetylglucosaminyl deacetylase